MSMFRVEDYYSMLLLSYSIASGAIGSPDLRLSHSIIALPLHNIIILIIKINLIDNQLILILGGHDQRLREGKDDRQR